MIPERTPAPSCTNMIEVRHGVDEIDRHLVELLSERFRYMEAAARIKLSRDLVRDEARKAEVIANVSRLAAEQGLPAGLVEELWEILVEASIAYEMQRYDALRA